MKGFILVFCSAILSFFLGFYFRASFLQKDDFCEGSAPPSMKQLREGYGLKFFEAVLQAYESEVEKVLKKPEIVSLVLSDLEDKKTKLKNVVPSFRKAGIHPSQEKNAWAEVQLNLFMKIFMSPILVKGAQKKGFPHLKELLYVKSRMVSNDLNYGDDVTAYDLIVLLGLVQRRMGRQGIQKILGLALS